MSQLDHASSKSLENRLQFLYCLYIEYCRSYQDIVTVSILGPLSHLSRVPAELILVPCSLVSRDPRHHLKTFLCFRFVYTAFLVYHKPLLFALIN